MSTSKTLLRACPAPQRQSTLLPLTHRRFESSTRRHRKLLFVPQSPSYTPDRTSPTLVYNPPSSAPNVYHTPLKFLPQEDKRRALYAAAQQYTSTAAHRRQISPIATPGTPLSVSGHLPPRPTTHLPTPVRAPYEKSYHLSESDVAKIQRLRSEDPKTWTRVALAEKFGCSQFFVGMVAKNKVQAESVARRHEGAREKWGARRKIAKEDRERRKALWGRDA